MDPVVLRVSGRLTGDDVDTLRALLEEERSRAFSALILDLKDVRLLDQEAVKLLAIQESNGTKINNCPRSRDRIQTSRTLQCHRASDRGMDLQQLREALPGDRDCKFLLHHRHKTFSASLDEQVENWAIHVLRSPVRRPTANAHCERLIGTIRRECLDYIIPLDSAHLRRILREWVRHYNTGRPHRSLGSGIPDGIHRNEPTSSSTSGFPSPQRVVGKPILRGLHHEHQWPDAA
jgi:hypothetical protein